MATLLTYRAKVQAEVDDTSARAQTVIDNGIADVYQEILRYIPELVGTVNEEVQAIENVAEPEIPAFTRIKSIHWKSTTGDRFNMLEEITEDEYLVNYVNADAVENPSKYYVSAQLVHLVPAPNNEGTVLATYYPVSDELTGDAVSVIPTRFTKVVVLGAIARFYAYMRLPDADSYQNDFLGALESMRTEIVNNSRKPQPNLYGRRRYALRRV